jgi:hypothetical protein
MLNQINILPRALGNQIINASATILADDAVRSAWMSK